MSETPAAYGMQIRCAECGNYTALNEGELCAVCAANGAKADGTGNDTPGTEPSNARQTNGIRQKIYGIAIPDLESENQRAIAQAVQRLGRVMLDQNEKHGDTLMQRGVLSNISAEHRLLVHAEEKLEQLAHTTDRTDRAELAVKLAADLLNYGIAVER